MRRVTAAWAGFLGGLAGALVGLLRQPAQVVVHAQTLVDNGGTVEASEEVGSGEKPEQGEPKAMGFQSRP